MESQKIVLGGARMGTDGISFEWNTDRYLGQEIRVNKFTVTAPSNSTMTPLGDLPQGMSKTFWEAECLGLDPASRSCTSIMYTRKKPTTDLAIFKGMTWADIDAKWPRLSEMGYDKELRQFCIDEGKYKSRVVDVKNHPVLRAFFAQKFRDTDQGVGSDKIRQFFKTELCEIFKLAEKLAMMKDSHIVFKFSSYPDDNQALFPLLELRIEKNDMVKCSCSSDEKVESMDNIDMSFIDEEDEM